MSCLKSQGFLEQNQVKIVEQTDARKERKGAPEALALARSVDRVVVGRGKKVVSFDMRKAPPDEETLLAHLLGPTGNLKAPTLRRGRVLLVGFSEEAYRQVLGE
jgi:hypothetical protein